MMSISIQPFQLFSLAATENDTFPHRSKISLPKFTYIYVGYQEKKLSNKNPLKWTNLKFEYCVRECISNWHCFLFYGYAFFQLNAVRFALCTHLILFMIMILFSRLSFLCVLKLLSFSRSTCEGDVQFRCSRFQVAKWLIDVFHFHFFVSVFIDFTDKAKSKKNSRK